MSTNIIAGLYAQKQMYIAVCLMS